jgi:hypothetical protein
LTVKEYSFSGIFAKGLKVVCRLEGTSKELETKTQSTARMAFVKGKAKKRRKRQTKKTNNYYLGIAQNT